MIDCIAKRLLILALLLNSSHFLFADIQEVDSVSAETTTLEQHYQHLIALGDTNLLLGLDYGSQVLKNLSEPKDSLLYASFLNIMGNLNYLASDYEKAFAFYYRANSIQERQGAAPRVLASTLMNMGNVLYANRTYDKALDYLRNSIRILRSSEETTPKKIGFRHNTIGLCFQGKGMYDSARYYYQLAIEEIQQDSTSKEWDVIETYDNLADLLKIEGESEEAISYLKKSLEVSLKNDFYFDIAWTADHLADSYIRKRDREKAAYYLRLGMESNAKAVDLNNQLDLTRTALRFYTVFHNEDSTLHYLDELILLSDSFYAGVTERNVQEMEAKYQVEKKEAALKFSKEKAARLDAENKSQRIYLIASITVLIVLIIVFMIAYRSYQRKKQIAQMELEIKDSRLDELMSDQESKVYASMLKGQEKERNRVARELHDRLGGTLAALRLSLKGPANQVSEEDIAVLDQAVADVRSIAHNLSSGLIEKYGFNQALKQLFGTLERSGGIKFSFYLHPSISTLGESISLELYRIVQELSANTIKHAGASEVSLQTNFDGDTFNLIYEDNGRGFDPQTFKAGMGLDNIKSRVEKLNGELHIDAEKGRGTIVIIEIKLKHDQGSHS